jgi:hypothetical protein
VPFLAPPPVAAEVQVADYLVARPGAFRRKRFQVKALRMKGGKPTRTEFENVQDLAVATATGSVTNWLLSAGTSTESFAILPDGRVAMREERSWETAGRATFREYPAAIGAPSATFLEWTGSRASAKNREVRLTGREVLRAAGRTFEAVVFETSDGVFRFRTWNVRGLAEVRSDVHAGGIQVSERRLVAIEP